MSAVPLNLFLALSNMYFVLSKLMGNLFLLLQYIICKRSAEISSFILSLSVLLVVEREVSRIVHIRIQATNFAELLMGMSCLQNAC